MSTLPPRRPLPRLIDDLIPEILLRIPPDDPACLARASLACKPWRRVLADPGFLRRYRAFHRTPPMLGFLRNTISNYGLYTYTANFVSTSSFRPAAPDRRGMLARDVRHGRVLLGTDGPHEGFVVWVPVTDDQWAVPPLPAMAAPLASMFAHYKATVFCTATGCDHLDCHGGPFAVALVGSWVGLGRAIGCVYSSETGEWGELVPALHGSGLVGTVFPCGMGSSFTLLVGNVFYITCKPNRYPFIVEYDMAGGKLSAFDLPFLREDLDGVTKEDGRITVTEDGRLGFASVFASELFLWSREARPSGAMAWKLRRNIKLNMICTSRDPQHKVTYGYGSSQPRPCVVGFADGGGVVFVGTEEGAVFSVELKSGRARKTSLPKQESLLILPYLSFYTPVASPSMKSLQIEEVAISDGGFLGDNKKQLDLGGDVDMKLKHFGDVGKQTLMRETLDEQQEMWDAIDEQKKLKNQEDKRQTKQNKKRKDLKKMIKKSAKIHESKMVRAKGGVSCSARKLSQRVAKSSLGRLPLVRSLGLNMLRSPLRFLASATASKRGRYRLATDECTPERKRAKSSVMSPYRPTVRSPLPRGGT